MSCSSLVGGVPCGEPSEGRELLLFDKTPGKGKPLLKEWTRLAKRFKTLASRAQEIFWELQLLILFLIPKRGGGEGGVRIFPFKGALVHLDCGGKT